MHKSLLFCFALQSIIIATGAAVAQDAGEPAKYQQLLSTDCSIQGDCALLFPALTKRVLMLHISCSFQVLNGTSVISAVLGSQDFGARNNLQVFTYGTNAGFTIMALNSETYLFYKIGQQPRVDVYSVGSPVRFLTCTVSGNALPSS